MSDTFNLVTEPWIPIADGRTISLHDAFADPQIRALGGNPLTKISILKLLLAIGQAAATPADEQEWEQRSPQDTAQLCVDYLTQWKSAFDLYGDAPFLQMTSVTWPEARPIASLMPEIATGNTSVLKQSQVTRPTDDAEKARALVQLMNFSLGGKKGDNSRTLTPGYAGKKKTSRPGPAVGHMGFLHSFVLFPKLIATIHNNLFCEDSVRDLPGCSQGVGVTPWESMPTGEDDAVARRLTQTLMGKLIAMSRFVKITGEDVHVTEGIAHQGYKDGVTEPSVAVDTSKKNPRALWVDPNKRPWRELTSLLSFVQSEGASGFYCPQLKLGINRAGQQNTQFSIWSGGIRVSSNAGEQYATGSDDYVASEIQLDSSSLGDTWFTRLKGEIDELEKIAKILYGCVSRYYADQFGSAESMAKRATNVFWSLCERELQDLIAACDAHEDGAEARQKVRRRMAGHLRAAFDEQCPRGAARQIQMWAQCRPNISKYLKNGEAT